MYLNEAQAAEWLNLSPKTLRNLRCAGGGPLYVKAGRRCLYDREDLSSWMAAQKVRSTSEASERRAHEQRVAA